VQGTQLHRRPRERFLWAAAFIVITSCSSAGHTPSGPAVNVTLKDFSIRSSMAIADAGPVEFDVYNQGPATHEFVVVRTDIPADRLPIAADGLSVDEDALAPVGEISEVSIWTGQTLDLRLSPGRYVFFCNLEGHYLGGMHIGFTVSGDG
jgi:uncharacterized cupredoxin-like copper-binding protein